MAEAIVDKMTMVIEGKYGQKKITVFSGHDSDVVPILTFFNLTTADCVQRRFRNESITGNCADPVPFASSIQFELHQQDSTLGLKDSSSSASGYYVKIKYNGDYYQVCGTTSFQC